MTKDNLPHAALKSGTWRRVLSHIKKYRLLLAVSLALAFGTVALTLYIPRLVGDAIDCIVGKGCVDFGAAVRVLIKIGIISLITSLGQWLMNAVNNRVTYSVVRDVRTEAFAKLGVLPLSYLDTRSPGDIVSRVIADADQLADGLLMGFSSLFTGVVTIIGTLIFMLTVHPLIALVVVVLTPLSLLTARFISRSTYSMFSEQSKARGAQTAYIDEMIAGQKNIHLFCREDAVQERFDTLNDELHKCSLKAIFFSSLVNPTTRFVNSVVYAAVALTGAFAAVSGSITIGGLSCFLSYANQYTKPFNEISGVAAELQNSLACAERLFELIEQPPQLPDAADALCLNDVRGAVNIDRVSFSYTPERPLIRDFSLNVKPGQRIAIVGPTGCGKTTLINLLMRFFDVDGGGISVDGTDIRDITRTSLRTSYGMVLQDTWLRSGTIRDNIKFGRPEATDEEMLAAAEAAHAHGFISRMPNGYDTVIGDEGDGLSQGQKQLLCIARVMLCLPPMLILDEATSSIDTRTEIKIQQAFAEMMRGRTSFIVAHRLSTIREADVILVMKDGNIVEQGKHEQLMAQKGQYYRLYTTAAAQPQPSQHRSFARLCERRRGS